MGERQDQQVSVKFIADLQGGKDEIMWTMTRRKISIIFVSSLLEACRIPSRGLGNTFLIETQKRERKRLCPPAPEEPLQGGASIYPESNCVSPRSKARGEVKAGFLHHLHMGTIKLKCV